MVPKISGSGTSVSLSSDGRILAIGEQGYSYYKQYPLLFQYQAGRVRVYKYSNSDWIQHGIDIVGGGEFYLFGYSISISSNGSVLAVGAPIGGCQGGTCQNFYSCELQNGGQVWVYQNMAVSYLLEF